jgi:hypothetical protein
VTKLDACDNKKMINLKQVFQKPLGTKNAIGEHKPAVQTQIAAYMKAKAKTVPDIETRLVSDENNREGRLRSARLSRNLP